MATEVAPVGGQMKEQKESFKTLHARIEATYAADPRRNSRDFKDVIELRHELEAEMRRSGW